jgi:hypothetical protein
MPTIQSKKYEDHVHYVTVEAWQVFKKKGLDRRYKVIDDSDIQDTVIKTPQAFEPIAFDNGLPISTELSRDEIKDLLTDKDVEFNPRSSTDKLKELLNQS